MPRVKNISKIMRGYTGPMGFAGGVATGLLATTPYMQTPFARIEALEEQLTKLAGERMKTEAEKSIALSKARGDIIEANVLFRPVREGEQPNPTLTPLVGIPVREITLEEINRYLTTGEISPDVVALPKNVLPASLQYQLGMMRIRGDQLSDLLKALAINVDLLKTEVSMGEKMGELMIPYAMIQALQTIQNANDRAKMIQAYLRSFFRSQGLTVPKEEEKEIEVKTIRKWRGETK